MKRQDCNGFTLIEVLFAVVILTAAMLPILGLQASSLDRVYRNEQEVHAVLIARQILSFVEGSSNRLRTSNANRTARQVLQQIASGNKGIDYTPPNDELLDRYQVNFIVEPWNMAMLGDAQLLRLTLTISWGNSAKDQATFVYLVPSTTS